MSRIFHLIFIGLVLTTSVRGQAAEISDQLTAYIQDLIDAGYIKGIVVGVTREGQEAYLSKGVRSISGKEAMDENAIFEIGSISKTFTGLLLAEMVMRGKLELDDPIQQYLPQGIKAPKRDGNSIRLVHLSNHTSGLPRMPTNFAPADYLNPFKDYLAEDMYQFLNGYKLTRDIGSSYEYSNLATGLLGHLLATAYKTTYESLLTSIITEPLGLEHTGITQVIGPLAKGYAGSEEVPNWDFSSLQGAGAIRSSASDMMRYLEANMGLIETKLYPAMRLAHANSGAADINPIVGLGWHTLIYDEKEIIWHNGATGGYTSFMGWIKGTDQGVVVLNNSKENVDHIGLNVLVPTYPLKAIRQSVILDKEVLAEFEGRYELAPGFVLTISRDGQQLTALATGQDALPIYPESETKFFYKVVDAQLVFNKNENGQVERVTLFQGGQKLVGVRLD